jgi:hypothetical protein
LRFDRIPSIETLSAAAGLHAILSRSRHPRTMLGRLSSNHRRGADGVELRPRQSETEAFTDMGAPQKGPRAAKPLGMLTATLAARCEKGSGKRSGRSSDSGVACKTHQAENQDQRAGQHGYVKAVFNIDKPMHVETDMHM